jgi:hypothetical protein
MLEGLNVSDETVPPLLPPPVIVSDASTDPVVTPAEMIAVAGDVAGCVVLMVTVPLVLPAGMMMLAVTEAAALLLVNVTAWPPEGAAVFSVTVPCEELPATTLVGLSVNEEIVMAGAGGVRVRVACCETPPTVTVTTTLVFDVTACVVMAKEVVVLVSVMTTLAGTLARPLLLESVTTTPPVGAGPLRFTVPWELRPPVTLDVLPFGTEIPGWLRVNEDGVTELAGVIVNEVWTELPFKLAVMVAVVVVLTDAVVMGKDVRM